MQQNQSLHFDVYRLDVSNECVWRGKQMLHLTTKAFAVLQYLLAQAGRLVTKAELFQAVWPDLAVSDAALTICISELRKVLGDTAQAPRFIATVHRRGYRFLAPVTGTELPAFFYAEPLAPTNRAARFHGAEVHDLYARMDNVGTEGVPDKYGRVQ